MIGVTLLIHAIIDIGSNTVRMAIYQIDSGRIEMLMKKKHMVGLAAYLKNGEMQKIWCEDHLRLQAFASPTEAL